MLKRNVAATLIVLLAAAGLSRAAAPQLPAKAIGAETIMLVYLDGATLTPDALRQAAQGILGANNAAVANVQIAKYQEHYDKAIKAGVQSMTFVATAANTPKPDAAARSDSPGQGVGYVALKPGADAAAVQKMFSDAMEPEQRAKMVFSREGNFLVMHEKNEKLPAAGDAARAAQFSEAINQAPAAGMVIVFVPNQAVRDKYEKEQKATLMPVLQQLAAPVLVSKWATLAINVGNKPALIATDVAADEASAKQLADAVNAALVQVKQMAQNAQNGQGNNPILMMLVPLVAPLSDALKPAQAGNRVEVSLQGQPLQTIAQTAMNFAAMMGMGGGNPGRGGRSPAGAPARGQ